MSTHAAIVVRKSTRDDAKVSLAQQEKRCREIVARVEPDLEVVVYSDEARSGTDMQRPGWLAFCDAVRRGDVRLVAAYEQSRLTRAGVATWDEVVVMLTKAGIDEVLTHRQGAIGVGLGNRMVGRFQALMDQEERERIIARARDAHAHLAAAGRPSGGRPYGYRSGRATDGTRTWIVDTVEAEVIERIAAEVIAGGSLRSIAEKLNADGIPTAKGRQWGSPHVRAVVTKPTVAGLRSHKGEIVAEGTWPAILPRDIWAAVVAVLSGDRYVTLPAGAVRRVARHHRRRTSRLLSPVAVCGRCTMHLVGARQTRHGAYVDAYACHTGTNPPGCGGLSIRADLLDGFVIGALLARLTDSPAVRAALAPQPVALEPLVAELLAVEDELAALGADYGAGRVDRVAFVAAQGGLAVRADRLRRQIEDATPAPVDEDPDTLPERWPSLPLAIQQAVVAAVIERVVVNPAKGGSRRVLERDVEICWLA